MKREEFRIVIVKEDLKGKNYIKIEREEKRREEKKKKRKGRRRRRSCNNYNKPGK